MKQKLSRVNRQFWFSRRHRRTVIYFSPFIIIMVDIILFLIESLNLMAGNTTIVFPRLVDLNVSSPVITKAFQTKENPFMSVSGKSAVQGDVMTIVLSHMDGSEISVKNTSKPIFIRLTRPLDQYAEYQTHSLLGTSLRHHRVSQRTFSLDHTFNQIVHAGLFANKWNDFVRAYITD
jgi:hypothetical protein